ncbi:unnamed protein product [Rotaria sp. Silwood2]|nr:unnamed protein product [Rotaria sp. Silwood2]CAF2612598.1 unnamed protein product [Rotaria sp. Silwood2]CAF3066526.1 unnamed protein product [Rotaria sp. Silwood2]CAF4111027.1 unnamed protein product [Rotaria sp. Silwood2]CAF4234028.1 unnamed protein product [Rotaria sp. Silwood2]
MKARDKSIRQVTKPPPKMKSAYTQTEEATKPPLLNMKSIYTQTLEEQEITNRHRWTSMLEDSPIHRRNKVTQTAWGRESKATQTGENVPPKLVSSKPIYFRPTPTTNFLVKVYRNGDRGRFAFCKSCSMEIILTHATQKLQMPMRARRLFDANGIEIYHSAEIRRDEEYFASAGENFKKPLN